MWKSLAQVLVPTIVFHCVVCANCSQDFRRIVKLITAIDLRIGSAVEMLHLLKNSVQHNTVSILIMHVRVNYPHCLQFYIYLVTLFTN